MTLFNEPDTSAALYSLLLLCAGFAFSYFPLRSPKVSGWFFTRYNPEKASVYLFLFGKILGFLTFGLLPAFLFYSQYTFTYQHITGIYVFTGQEWWIFLVLVSGIILMSYFAAGKEDVYRRVLQMSVTEWDYKRLATAIFGWSVYLLGYEFIFRQLFLFTWTDAFGPATAIAANGILYAVFHIPNGRKETLGTIPFGVVLCLVSLHTGSFVAAWLLHLTLSLSATFFSIYHHPEMSFKLAGK